MATTCDSVVEREPEGAVQQASGQDRSTRSVSWFVSWATRGGMAVADQALFAGSNFLLNVLLARWMSPTDYGAFALISSVFLLVSTLHNALLLEPMMIFGAGRYSADRGSYLGMVLRGHSALTVPAGILLIAAGVVTRFYSPSLQFPLYALALSTPLILLMWVTRRAFYVGMQPAWATAGGLFYLFGISFSAWWAHKTGVLTPATAMLLMALASLLTAAVQLTRLKPKLHSLGGLTFASVATEHWSYGKWALAAAIPLWVPMNIYFLVLPARFSLQEAGALKAMLNFASPALNSFVAFGMLLTPLLVQHRSRGGIKQVKQTVTRMTGVFFAGSLVYFVLVCIFRVRVLELIYGSGKYVEYSSGAIFLVGLVPLFSSFTIPLGSALRALELPDRLFWCYLASAGASILIGLPLTAFYGVNGALFGLLLSYATTTATMLLSFRSVNAR